MQMLLHLAIASLQLAPALPSESAVFDDPLIEKEIAARCAKTATAETCVMSTRPSVERLRQAYASSATTVDQRVKVLSLIDADRARGSVDWMNIVNSYFTWRGNITGDTQRELAKLRSQLPAPTRTTVETRCYSGYYSSSCVTTTR